MPINLSCRKCHKEISEWQCNMFGGCCGKCYGILYLDEDEDEDKED